MRGPAVLLLAGVLAGAAPLAAQRGGLETNEEGQPARLPPLPPGMTLDLIRTGDSLFHGKGNCFACHGADATGLPDAGSALTVGLNFVPIEWRPIDSLITVGIPDAITRSAIRMPPRGGKSDLTADETRAVAAYVWAISQTRGEPWPGGHQTHVDMVPPGSTAGTSTARPRPLRSRPQALRVCADPNNLPFSNAAGEGFENRIAAVLAREMGDTLSYTWWPQRRGFIRNTLKAGRCDVIMGIPASDEMVLTTAPYYTSTYVFLARRDSGLHIRSFDDPALRRVRIGIHLIGDDYTNPPPAHALGRRGIARNVTGYTVYGDYSKPNPPARLVDAVAGDDVDVAIIWGPFAGYFAPREGVPMTITPVSPRMDPPGLPFVFRISLGVRPGDQAHKIELERALTRRRSEIHRILLDYGVPLVDDMVAGR